MSRTIQFSCDGDHLKMEVASSSRPYSHTCPREVFEAVADFVADLAGTGVCGSDVSRALSDVPHTQVRVAFAFLVEMGCVRKALTGKRYTSDSPTVYEDALGAFWHLAEVGK
jgi:hypothetical protein